MPTNSFTRPALGWLAEAIGDPTGRPHITPMIGSTSSSIFSVHVSTGPSQKKFVLRLLDNHEWLREEPDLAEHEAAALAEARAANLRAPSLVAIAPSDAGFGCPAVLMSFVEGRIELRPADLHQWLRELARELVTIHQHPAHIFPWHYRTWLIRENIKIPSWAQRSGLWAGAVYVMREEAPDYRPTFIHRDFHPVNVLWVGDSVSGVVDWVNACRGPAGVDVAHCGINLATMYGAEAAAEFLEVYRAAAPEFIYHPYWDLEAIFDSCLPQPCYYEPWREFGLEDLPPSILMERMEHHLAYVMSKF